MAMKLLRSRLSGLAFLIAVLSKGETLDICANYPSALNHAEDAVGELKAEWGSITKKLPEYRHKDSSQIYAYHRTTPKSYFKCLQGVLSRWGEYHGAEISLLKLHERGI